VNALYVWGVARALGGRVLLRVEDHDRVRSRPILERALLEDLDWLGFVPDIGRHPVLRQSDRLAGYEAALNRLRAKHTMYACTCSRKAIGGKGYRGTCRHLALDESPGRGLRIVIDHGTETFVDALVGTVRQVPADESGDELVRDRNGHWTYQFAVAVDDQRDAVTLVIRGADLLGSSGRQVRLGRMLGRPAPPQFLHHPLLRTPAGRKLSKAHGDVGIRQLRAAGVTAAETIGRAASLVGLQTAPRPIAAAEVAWLFG
jgi:glutamyl/glutaminyl-tRNA synthetase